MQTISWEEESKLTDCLLYHINFEQDFTHIYINNRAVSGISVHGIIEYIKEVEAPHTPDAPENTSSTNSNFYYLTDKDWNKAEKKIKKEIEAEEEWEYKNSPEYYMDFDDTGSKSDIKAGKKAWKKRMQQDAFDEIESCLKKWGVHDD